MLNKNSLEAVKKWHRQAKYKLLTWSKFTRNDSEWYQIAATYTNIKYHQSKLWGDWIVTIRADITLWPRFIDHLTVPDWSTILNSCYYRYLWLSFCCIVVIKLSNFDTNTHNPELYLLSFSHFLFSLEFKNAAKWQKYVCICAKICLFISIIQWKLNHNRL